MYRIVLLAGAGSSAPNGAISPLLADVWNPEAARGAEAPFRATRGDEDEHEDRHHVLERLEDLRRDARQENARLEGERQRGERAEEVRADEAEVGAPEGEDDERDRDPARAAGEAAHPLRRDLEAEAGAADAGEGAP